MPVSFFSKIFEPSNVKNHRLSAEAALRLRQQALRNLHIEVGMLEVAYNRSAPIFNALLKMYDASPGQVDDELLNFLSNIKTFRSDVEDFFEGVLEGIGHAKNSLDPKMRHARSASEFASLTNEEMEFREALVAGVHHARELLETSNDVLISPLSRLGPDARRAFFGDPLKF